MAELQTLPFTQARPVKLFTGITLWQRFLIASLVVIAGGMAGIAIWVCTQIQNGVIHQTAAYSAIYVSSVVEPHLQDLATAKDLSPVEREALNSVFSGNELGQRITAVKVFNRDRQVVYSTNTAEIGQAGPGAINLTKALRGWLNADIVNLAQGADGRTVRRLETYSPIRRTGTSDIVAAVVFYQTVDSLDDALATAQRNSWLIVGLAAAVMYLLLAGFVKRASDTIRRQQNELSAQVERLQSLLEQNETLHNRVREASRRTSSTNERFLRRIGAELHDGPAQDLGLALLRLEHLVPEASQRGADYELVQSSLQHALQEIRAISAGMSLPELEQLDISETVSKAVRAHERRTATTVTLNISDSSGTASALPGQVSLATKMALYRVVQESLGNAFRHAQGKGQIVDVHCADGRLDVRVSDSGPGFASGISNGFDEHLGIAGMRERVESLGGTFLVESKTGSGTTVRATLPLDAV